ncbi:hypothetical protein EGW08_016326, partial [Elysia chlorotica]
QCLPFVVSVRAVARGFAGFITSQAAGLGRAGASSSQFQDDTMDGGVAVEDFINTGRTGRRNAVPDITDARVAGVSTAGMDFSFDQLSMADPKAGPSDSSKQKGADSGNQSQAASKS